jgi:hypothetical protein
MNKRMFLALFVLVVSGQLMAQDARHAPEAVQKSFQKDYPGAKDPQWSSTNGQWHAGFTDQSEGDRGEMVSNYDESGIHIDSQIPYDLNDVPAAVVGGTQKSYPTGTNYTYTRIERPDGDPLFQVDMNLQNKNKTTYMDESGHEQKYPNHHQ